MAILKNSLFAILVILLNCFFTSSSVQAANKLSGCKITNPIDITTTIVDINVLNTATTSLSFECDAPKNATDDTRVAYCFNIDRISPAGQHYNPRQLYLNGSYLGNATELNFDFYAMNNNSGAYTIIGDENGADNIIGMATKVGNKYRVTTPIQVRIKDSNETNPDTGPYKFGYRSVIYGGATQVIMEELENGESLNTTNACGKTYEIDNTQAQSKVMVHYDASCYIKVNGEMAFGKQPLLNEKIQQTVLVNSNCSGGTNYTVSINNGNHYQNGTRNMALNGSDNGPFIAYSISPESWTGIGANNTAGLTKTVTGTVPQQDKPAKGHYQDQLIVELTIN